MALMMAMFGFGPAAAADRPAPSDVAARPDTPSQAFVVHRQLEAEVSRVNRDVGTVLLKTDAGRVTLHAAPEAAAALRKGDRVVIDVAIIRHPDPAQIPRERRTPAPLVV
jgi:tRNA threonylcarbamoyladenosine modification (KEOPS) complex  Pcc1 subunit